ncbi:SDR family oxidoreductase [Rhodococcus sp. C3V]|uniref:SDR family oxidoreductase n=1 Tax=Rhodococcus sp. C3V TaxID=3034165 RepID=UPI0023E2ACF6|nr:SDR family oxidoreductase [Rhodococcus sp. C3V]MDF3319971.1 SDR family oxidoreductase [Rhodococcus sp. C3V]
MTGGSRGIGKMIARGFLAQGAKVYITGRNVETCDAAAEELSAYGQCVSLPGDVSSPNDVDRIVATIESSETSLEILVNNAGLAWFASIDEFPEIGWDEVMSVNVKAPFFLTQRLLPLLTPKPDLPVSKVINIASIDGLALYQGETYSYHASKAALVHLTKRLSVDLATRGIGVTAIAPGAFPSDMHTAARDDSAKIAAVIPAGRVGGADDIAAAAIYLASRAGDYVVGTTLVVDGGLMLSRGIRLRR